MRGYLVATVVLMLVSGCEKDSTSMKMSTLRMKPPASLVVDITRSSVGATDGLRQFASAINPLLAIGLDDAAILSSLRRFTGLGSLDGIDRDAPIHVLIVDAPAAKGVAVLAKIKDGKLLESGKGTAILDTRDGWVVFGHEAVVHEVSRYALEMLVGAPSPAKPTATIYLSQLATTHAADFEAARVQIRAKADPKLVNLMDSYFDGVLAFAKDTQELRVTLDASASQLALDLELFPTPRSKLAGFVAAQAPSDFAMLDKLPEGPAPILLAGRMTLGPYHDAMVAMLATFYGAPGVAEDVDAVMKLATGEVGISVQMSAAGMEMTQLAGLTDSATVDAVIARIQTALANGQPVAIGTTKVTYKSVPGTTDHDGVALRGFDTTYDATTAKQEVLVSRITPTGNVHAEIAAFDHFFVNAAGAHAKEVVGRTIDAARGKGPHFAPSADVAALLDGARASKASLALVIDVAMLKAMIAGVPTDKAAPILATFGSRDLQAQPRAHLGIVVPVGSARALVQR